MLKIGDFSKITNVTIRALHHYEELGILIPETIDATSHYRYYSACQISVINKIKMLQQLGFSLKIIKEILQNDDIGLLEYYYELRENELHNELEALKMKQKIIAVYKEQLKNNKIIEKYNVTLKEVPERKVMALRKVIPSYNDEHMLWIALHSEFVNQSVKMDNPLLGMTIYHDREYKETDIDIEVQNHIVGEYHNTKEVLFYQAPKFTMASTVFNGSYEQMDEVTQSLALWIEANGYEICGPMVNIPYVSPAQDPNPNSWITEAGFIISK
jgi:Predicted transcriptional regulators